jgi:hypothetical protein
LGGVGVDWKIYADVIILKRRNSVGTWMNRDSVVGVVTGLRAGVVVVGIPASEGIFLFSRKSKPALGAHPPSYSDGDWGSFPGVKAAGA